MILWQPVRDRPRSWGARYALLALASWALTEPAEALAQGLQDGARVMAIASDARQENLQLLDAYGAARGLPAGNRCVLGGLPDAATELSARVLTADDYQALVLTPVQACLADAHDPDAIDFLVVIRGMPNHVTGQGWQASLEAALTVGVTDVDGEPLWNRAEAVNQRPTILSPLYKAFAVYDLMTELKGGRFPTAPHHADIARDGPQDVLIATAAGLERVGPVAWDLRPAYRLDGGSDEATQALIDRSVESDYTAPDGLWMCMTGADPARGVRDRECGRALDLLEDMQMRVARPPWTADLTQEDPVIAYLTGAADLRGAIDGVAYRPGALTDNITSFGAVPQNWSYGADGESQTSIVRFLEAGASSTHGTSAEPLNGAFASAGLMVLYAHGYTMGEAYALALPYLRWMNVPVGDPLMAPYAPPPPPDPPDEAGEGEGERDPPEPDEPETGEGEGEPGGEPPGPGEAPDDGPDDPHGVAEGGAGDDDAPAPPTASGARGGDGGGCRVGQGLLLMPLRR